MSLGFVIVRHVNNEETNQYWQEAYTCIRKWYDYPILIVDDNSDPNFLHSDLDLVNCQVVNGEYPKAGELLGYYYFHQLKPFDKAIIIHDSVFIKQKIDFESTPECCFMWTFTHHWDIGLDEPSMEIISKFNQSEELLELYKNKDKWSGCFGIMSIITWNFLNELNESYRLFPVLLSEIKDRNTRMCLERIFACVCAHKQGIRIPTMLGNIHQYCRWGRLFSNYKLGENAHLPVIKVWTGR